MSDLLLSVTLAARIGRYGDMIDIMRKLIYESDEEFSKEERSLFSLAYKEIYIELRTSLVRLDSFISSSQQMEELRLVARNNVILKIIQHCSEAIVLIHMYLVPLVSSVCASQFNDLVINSLKFLQQQLLDASSLESLHSYFQSGIDSSSIMLLVDASPLVFYYKMIADQIRFICEVSNDTILIELPFNTQKHGVDALNYNALAFYVLAYEISILILPRSSILHLSLCLNIASFFLDILHQPENAIYFANLDLLEELESNDSETEKNIIKLKYAQFIEKIKLD